MLLPAELFELGFRLSPPRPPNVSRCYVDVEKLFDLFDGKALRKQTKESLYVLWNTVQISQYDRMALVRISVQKSYGRTACYWEYHTKVGSRRAPSCSRCPTLLFPAQSSLRTSPSAPVAVLPRIHWRRSQEHLRE